ncbi:MAG: 6-pyruvoyl-tetrahydropterin synthase-related protein [Candidatus Acidiferrales bacterium]
MMLLLIAAATAVVSPMFFLGNASGHDFGFHLASWMDVAGQWHEGIVYPRWAEWANWGFGEPRFVFYPPASWMLGAVLGSLLPWRMAPGAFIWLVLILAGLAMWRLAREWLAGPEAAVAAVFFAVNPYHLVLIYYRSDFAELLASALFPLMIWGARRVIREGWRGVPSLAIVFALIWLSNAPAAVIATYSLALLLVVGCILRRSARPLIPGGVALATGLGLAAFYILPAAYEQRWVQIKEVLAQNLRTELNFLFTHATDPEFVLFNWKVSGVALGVMMIAGIAAVFAARRRRDFFDLWWMLLALGAASTLLMFPLSLLLWRYLPELHFVQFPWRWLLPLGVAYAFFFAAALGRSRRPWMWCAVWVIVIAGTATAIVRDAWWDSEDIPVLSDAIQRGYGYEGTDEYAPLGCDRYSLPGVDPSQPEAVPPPTPRLAIAEPKSGDWIHESGVRPHIDQWTAERKVFLTETKHQEQLAVRLINYPAWRVQVDGKPVQASSRGRTAQLTMPLPAGTHRVEIRFARTWDRSAGIAISALSGIVLLAFGFVSRRRE